MFLSVLDLSLSEIPQDLEDILVMMLDVEHDKPETKCLLGRKWEVQQGSRDMNSSCTRMSTYGKMGVLQSYY